MTEPNPFAILDDPVVMARAEAAWATAWSYVEQSLKEEERERQSQRMIFIVASTALETDDVHELAHRSIKRFLQEGPLQRPT
ncbi:hypothetical protein [uncultured Bosea sp.]|uniref:hypothetical protein n=1 Tax=uncultured Bosea sp. TaxID=211457 RepID=UPI0025EAB70B|nr:hypothetical protein [uncultured Bosea sp.]